MRYLIYALTLISLAACYSTPHPKGEADYKEKIEKYSAGDKQFAGLYHNFEFKATILNNDVVQTVNQRMTQMYQWDEKERQEKMAAEQEKMAKKTRLWLSFFTPNSNDDNLAKQKTIWKIYLDAGGSRYEGRAEKANANLSEASSIYPYHNRWATPYYLSFPVPTNQIEGLPLKLTITGPLGTRTVDFPESAIR